MLSHLCAGLCQRSSRFQMAWLASVSWLMNSEKQISIAKCFGAHLNLIKSTMLTKPLFSVIGRGGEQISRIQQDSGCKIQISPGESNCSVLTACISVWLLSAFWRKNGNAYSALYPTDSGGMPERSVTLTGSPDSVQWVSPTFITFSLLNELYSKIYISIIGLQRGCSQTL